MSVLVRFMAAAVSTTFGSAGFAQQPAQPDHPADQMDHMDRMPQAATEETTQSEREHVPPAPPQHELRAMPYGEMAEMMAMNDREPLGKVMLDRLDWRDASDASSFEWDVAAWYGGDYNKAWLKTEGEHREGTTEDVRVELLWDRVFSRWWSAQAGIRQDLGEGPSRTWASFGVQGLAPYFFEVEAAAYIGEEGRTAVRLSTDYDLLLTQRLILQPEVELNLYGKDDPARGIGSGLSELELSLRLRYEFRPELAPYVGVAWSRRFGRSADLARSDGEDPNDLQVLAGLRIWF